MSRRRTHRDPVVARAVSNLSLNGFGTTLDDLLSAMPQNEVDILRRVLNGTPLVRIAEADGISVQAARGALAKCLSRLRHPSRSQFLRDMLDDDVESLLSNARTSALNHESRGNWHWCDRHEKWVVYSDEAAQCAHCPCGLLTRREQDHTLTAPGRPRVYCSNACRQAAFRARNQGRTYSGVARRYLVLREADVEAGGLDTQLLTSIV